MRRSQTMQEQMMKKKRRRTRSRRRNIIKLRVMGVLALIASILISLIPMPSLAMDDTAWFRLWNYGVSEDAGEKILTLNKYTGGEKAVKMRSTVNVIVDGQSVSQQYKVRLGNLGVFENCTNVETVDFTNIDLSNVTDMSRMFAGCSNLKDINFGDNTLEDVESMLQTFEGCTALETITWNSVNPIEVKTFANTFTNCESLTEIDLTKFKTTAATDMSRMFSGCTALETLTFQPGVFDTSQVTSMVDMFKNCEKLVELDLSAFTTGNLTHANGMFDGCKSLQTLTMTTFDTSAVTSADNMFRNCESITTLDLSSYDMSKIQSATGMLEGTRADTIETPTKLTSNTNIPLPDTYEDDGGTEYNYLPKGNAGTNSITLTGPKRVESVKIFSGTDDISGQTITITKGYDQQLRKEITPDEAKYQNVTWTSSDDTKVQVDDTGKLSAVEVTETGTPVTITVTTEDGGKTDYCKVTVINEVIDVKDISLSVTKKKLKVGENLSLSATVLPDNATDKTVKWGSDNKSVVSVDENGLVTAHKESKAPVVITATSANGKVAKCEITPVDEYTVKLSDERADASNRSLSTVSMEKKDIKSDVYVTVSEIDSVTIRDLLEQREGYSVKDASYFKVSKVTDENGAELNDYGRMTLTLAMPGRLMNKGLTPRLYRYSAAEKGLLVVSSTATELGNDYKVEAFSFDITDATDDTQYVIVLETKTGYSMYVNDQRSVNPQDASAAVTNMHSDLYFFVQDKQKPAIEVLIDQNQNLSSYKTREYYEMFITYDSAGKNHADDFGICYITLTLPKEMDYTKGDIKVVSMQQNGNQMALDTSFTPEFKTDANGVQYVTIRTTHFSEYALLYLENEQQQQPGAGGSTTTGATTGQTTGTGAGTSNTQGTGATTGQSTGTGATTGNTTGNTTGGATTGSTSAGVTPTSGTNSNSADMPTTGATNLPLYRNMGVVLLALAGASMLIASKLI